MALGTKRTRMIIGIVLLVVIVPLAFVGLVYHSVSSLTVASWGMKPSSSGWTLIIRITVAIGNKGTFDVTIWNPKVKLIINSIDMGTVELDEEWYIIPAFGWRQFIVTYEIHESQYRKDLYPSTTLNVDLNLRGEASCIFYKTIFETSSRAGVIQLPLDSNS